MIRIEPPLDPAPLTAAVKALRSYQWLVFTSQNGVRAFFAELKTRGWTAASCSGCASPPSARARPRRSSRTAAWRRAAGQLPREALAEIMLREQAGSMQGVRVLLPERRSRATCCPDLARGGGTVDVVEAYRTYGASAETASQLRALLERGAIDVITFTASSTWSIPLQPSARMRHNACAG